MEEHKLFLKQAVENARESMKQGGFPAGAVLVLNGAVVGKGLSLGYLENDPTGHGEINAIRNTCKKLSTGDLTGATLYTSMEPCLMCFGAANWVNVSEIVFASKKENLPKDFYEGASSIEEIDRKNLKKVKMTFVSGFEDEIMEIVNEFMPKWKKF